LKQRTYSRRDVVEVGGQFQQLFAHEPVGVDTAEHSFYKADTPPRLSRELLVRAIAYRMQEVASGGPRLELQRQLRQIGLELQQTGRLRIRPQLRPGTRLMREWQARSYEVLVLDDGFSWQGTHYRWLSAIARQITATAWSGPLFFGLRSNRSATRSPA
jgi:hypothetical protein